MMIDNPHVIREVASTCNAHATDPSVDAMLHDEEFQKKIQKLADDFAPVAEEAWNKDFNGKGNEEFSRG